MSEVGTKLDLARAYMDMGDPEGARSILAEVLSEGSVSQKQEARRLMERSAWLSADRIARSMRLRSPSVARRHRVRRQRLLRLAGAERRRRSVQARARAALEPGRRRAGRTHLCRPHRCRCARARAGGALRHRWRAQRARLAARRQHLPAARYQPALGAPVPDHFHARYSALARTYRYLILNRSGALGAAGGRALLVHRPLDVAAMQQARALADRRARFQRLSLLRVPGALAGAAAARAAGRALGRLGHHRGDRQCLPASHGAQHRRACCSRSVQRRRAPEHARERSSSRASRSAVQATAAAHGLYLWRVDYPRLSSACRPIRL